MDRQVAELVAELPEDLQGPATAERELADLVATLARKPVPTGRVLRMWCLGTLQAKIAAAYMLAWVRGTFAGEEKRARLKSEAHLKAAVRLLASMGYMRGAIMKVGQIFASFPQVVPAEFVETLKAFHFEAPPMHYSLLREQVRKELGADPEDVFAEFETEAFAAASLGQVHRARLASGQPVAVKIQYPNIARTIRADFANLRAVMQPFRFTKDWENLLDTWAEMERVLVLETDYRNELENAEKVRVVLDGLKGVVIPRMFPEHSTERVLTMEYVPGLHADAFMAQRPSPEQCDAYGERILRVTSRLFHAGRMFAADPNPGNFVFMPDGRLGLLDFGCVRELDDEEWKLFELGIDAYRHGGEALRASIQRTTLLSDEEMEDEERYQLTVDMCEWLWEAMRRDEPFDFGQEDYLRRGLRLFGELVRRRYTRAEPMLTWMNRTFIGLRALLYLLRARANLSRIEAEETERAGH